MILLLPVAAAATWTVDPAGSGDAESLTDAVALASSGDTITLPAGTLTDCVSTAGKSLTISGAGKASTVLSGGDCDNTIAATSGESLVLADLTLSHAAGRGLYSYYSTVHLEGVAVTDAGTASLYGGGIYAEGGSLTTTDCTFSGNTAEEGGAIYLYAYATYADSGSTFDDNTAGWQSGALHSEYQNALTLSGTVMSGNTAGGYGGAISLEWYSSLSMDAVTLTGNAATSGGGLYVYAVTAELDITDSSITDNTADGGYGGGIAVEWYPTMLLEGVTVSGNTATYSGGGIYFFGYGSLGITASTFADNHSTSEHGGAIYHYAYTADDYFLDIHDSDFTDNTARYNGGAVEVLWVKDLRITDSRFDRNSGGDDATGGALLSYVTAASTLSGNRFCANSAGYGGGVAVQWSTTDAWTNNLFVENTAALTGGGASRYADYDSSTRNNTFVGNSSGSYGGGYYASWSYSDITSNIFADTQSGSGVYAADSSSLKHSSLTHNGWHDNAALHGGGYFYAADGVDGNTVAAPAFVDWSMDGDCGNDDLRLASDSPLRGTGDPEQANPDGAAADPGAYGGPDAPIEDHDGDGFDTTSDCSDTDDAIHPDADELCDGLDNDCDGDADEDAIDASTWYTDADGDGYGAAAIDACQAPKGAVSIGGDCDDDDPAISPGASEIADDGIDNDCDGGDAVSESGDSGGDTPSPETPAADEDKGGCATVAGGSGWLLAALLLGWRRRSLTARRSCSGTRPPR